MIDHLPINQIMKKLRSPISNRSLEKIAYFFAFTIITLIFPAKIQPKLLIILAYYLNIRLLIQYRNVLPIFIFFLFSFTYITPFFYHFYLGTKVAIYDSFNESRYLGEVILIYCLFLYSIFLFSKPVVNYIFLRQRLTFNSSGIKFYFLIIIILLLAIFGLQGESLLNGIYGHVDKLQSTLFEYSLIFIAITVTYLNSKKKRISILLLSLLFIIMKDLLFGGRITSIQIILLIYILFYEDRVSKRWIYLIFIIGYFVMEAFNIIRSNPILFMSGNFTFKNLFTQNQEFLMTNQGDVAHASARLLGLIDVGLLNFETRISSLFYFIISIFTKGELGSELGNLATYKKEIYQSGGGGLFPVYFFVWLSYPGVILSGFLFNKITKLFLSSRNNYLLLYACLVMSTYPRWLAYNPITMFKLCIYIIPIYYIYKNLSLPSKLFLYEHRN